MLGAFGYQYEHHHDITNPDGVLYTPSYDSVGKCKERLVIGMIAEKAFAFPDRVVLLLQYSSCCVNFERTRPAQSKRGVCPLRRASARTQDHRREAAPLLIVVFVCGPVLLLPCSGHTHAHKTCASYLWAKGSNSNT